MRINYPDPHPHKVLDIPRATGWNYRGSPIPTRDEFLTYMVAQGREASEADYGTWKAKVEKAKAANMPKASNDPAPVPAAPEAPAPAIEPAIAVPVLPHRQARPEPVRMEVMSVRVREGINARLDRYRVHHRVSKQDVVSDVLDAFLTSQGF